MTVPYSLRQQGWVFVDHAGGITSEQARAIGLPLDWGKEGVHEVDTLHCRHCGGCVIKNPDRIRSRGHCTKCDWYVCDPCFAAMQHPDYIHTTIMQRIETLKAVSENLGQI